jgi:hypothetical protein
MNNKEGEMQLLRIKSGDPKTIINQVEEKYKLK